MMRMQNPLSVFERQAQKRLEPLRRRLNLPSRRALRALSQRIDALERRLRAHGPAVAALPPVANAADRPTCGVCNTPLFFEDLAAHTCASPLRMDTRMYAELFWEET